MLIAPSWTGSLQDYSARVSAATPWYQQHSVVNSCPTNAEGRAINTTDNAAFENICPLSCGPGMVVCQRERCVTQCLII